MDENRLEGAATNIGGKVKDAVGGLVGDRGLQAQGKTDQVTGQVQNAYGSMADQLEEFVHDKPIVALLSAAAFGFVLARLIKD